MAGKFVISKAKNGEYTFNLKAANGEIVLTASETYSTLETCKHGVQAVKSIAGAPVEDQTKSETLVHPKFELYEDKAGEFRFRLTARNGQNIGKSQGYTSKESAKNGIESVAKNAPEAEIDIAEGE